VAVRAAQALQACIVAVEHPRAGFVRAGDELPHARVAPRRIDVHLAHRLRRVFKRTVTAWNPNNTLAACADRSNGCGQPRLAA